MEKLLNRSITDILQKIGEDTVNKVRVYIRMYWYNRYSPEDYERTQSLLEAVSYQIKNNTVVIYIDEEKLEHGTPFKKWGQHVGFDGSDFGAGLMEFIENGVFDSGKTGSPNNPRIGNGSEAIRRTTEWLNKYINDEVKRRLGVKLGVTFK